MAKRETGPDQFRGADLQDDFFDHSEDQVAEASRLLDALSAGRGDAKAALAEFKRIAHSLKGRGTMFEVPSVSTVAARLEDYMSSMVEPRGEDVAGLRRYFDLLDEIVDSRRDMAAADISKRLAILPTRQAGKVKG